jgi:asparagine synthase (glutamine-hydrolysing)
MSDVPLGAMLSGGLDSSLIVAFIGRGLEPTGRFFLGWLPRGEANELADARRLAEALGCEHHELELSVTENTIEFDELAWHLDEPVADISALGFDVLCQLASEQLL